ncbi:MAG TPA: hypothetical protein VIT67_15415 [Povalibacter sp.]
MGHEISVGSWDSRGQADYNIFAQPACLEDAALAQLYARKVPSKDITPQLVQKEIHNMIDAHNRTVASHDLGPGATQEQIDAHVKQLEQTQQWVTMDDGKRARVIPNHAGDGSLGRDGWNAHKDGWDLIHDGESLYLPQDMTQLAQEVAAQPAMQQKVDDLRKVYGQQAVDQLLASPAFNSLTLTSQGLVLDIAKDRGLDGVTRLINNPGFKEPSGVYTGPFVSVREQILQAYAKDRIFADTVDTLLTDYRYASNPYKDKVLSFLVRYAGQSAGSAQVDDGARRTALGNIAMKLLSPYFLNGAKSDAQIWAELQAFAKQGFTGTQLPGTTLFPGTPAR